MLNTIKEGKVEFYAHIDAKISKKLPVFYNPAMELNRTISVVLLKSFFSRKISVCLPMAGTGIRALRFLVELPALIGEICINDANPQAYNLINRNLELNKKHIVKTNAQPAKINVFNEDANLLMMKSKGFDYIDIDPFGTPNPFLDIAVRRVSRGGILAVTATDTSALAGTFPKACLRKYFAKPLHNHLKHESGLRILIRKIQMIGAQYGKAFSPLLAYAKQHYMRVFLKCEKGLQKSNLILETHKFLLYCPNCTFFVVSKNNSANCIYCGTDMEYAGPLYIGKIYHKPLIRKMLTNSFKGRDFLEIISNEVDIPGFYDLHTIAKKHKLPLISMDKLVKMLKEKDIKASRTHFLPTAIKADCSIKDIVNIMKHT